MSARTLEHVSGSLTFILFDVLRLRRALILSNLETAFGTNLSPEQRVRIGRASVRSFVFTILEFLQAGRGKLGDNTQVEGRENLETALAKGRGAYVLCIHMSSWEAMGAAVTKQIAPAHVVVKKVGGPGVNRFVNERRRRNGFYSIERRQKGDVYRAIRNTLGRGEIVGFVMDQSRPGEPELPFFGHPAKTNTSLAAIWRRCPAPIVPAFIRRTDAGDYVLRCLPELPMITTAQPTEREIIEHSELFNRTVEGMIRECPEQYFWMHDRWKK